MTVTCAQTADTTEGYRDVRVFRHAHERLRRAPGASQMQGFHGDGAGVRVRLSRQQNVVATAQAAGRPDGTAGTGLNIYHKPGWEFLTGRRKDGVGAWNGDEHYANHAEAGAVAQRARDRARAADGMTAP